MCGSWPWHPRPPKNTWPQKHFGIPLIQEHPGTGIARSRAYLGPGYLWDGLWFAPVWLATELSSGLIRILDFSFDGEQKMPRNAAWVDFRCVLHHFSSRTHLEGSRGPIWPESDRKSTKTKIRILVSAPTHQRDKGGPERYTSAAARPGSGRRPGIDSSLAFLW